ncbi:MAG: GNAT family N-acetyltransferase [Aestuariivirga sp.]
MITIRNAKPGDGEFLLKTSTELARTHQWPEGIPAQAADFETALFCASPIIGALIAEVDGMPAGSAIWHRSFSTNLGREIMYLEDLVVLPDFRQRGVARALLNEVAKVAVARGYPKIYWLAMEWNVNAIALYKSVGADVELANCYCSIQGQALLDLAK